MTSIEIRNQFFDFFKSKRHKIVKSSPVVPFDDPTLDVYKCGHEPVQRYIPRKGAS